MLIDTSGEVVLEKVVAVPLLMLTLLFGMAVAVLVSTVVVEPANAVCLCAWWC